MKRFLRVFLFITLFSSGCLCIPSSSLSQEVEAWTNLGLYGGLIYDIAIDPANPDKMFAGSDKGDGLFVTEDGGIRWQAVETENKPEGEGTFKNHAVRMVKIAPSNSRVIWVAHNHWVEKSTDGGRTWTHISDATMQRDCQYCGGEGDNIRHCMSVAIDPANPDIVYVGAAGPLNTYLPGAIYKTEDGGKTWTKMNQGADFDYSVVDIDIDPRDSSIIWAVTRSYGYGRRWAWTGTLYRSADGGETWTDINTINEERGTVRVKPNDSDTVFTGSIWGLEKHYFNGTEWQYIWPVIPEDYPNFGCRVVRDIEFDPQDPEVLYVSWRNPWFGDYLPRISISTNGGTDWKTHVVDHEFLCLAVHPGNRNEIFGGEFFGVYQSQDYGKTWTDVNNGINAVIVDDVQVDPNDSNHMLAASISGLFEKKIDEKWTRLLPQQFGSVEFDPVNSRTFYAGLGTGYVAKTMDGGLHWTYSHPGIGVRDIAVDPVITDTLFIAGGKEIQKSTDGGATFEKVLKGENTSGEAYAFNAVVIDPSDHFHIFAGGGNFYAPPVPGDLWESRDGGVHWTRTGLQNVTVNDVLINPQNPDMMYAGCGNSGYTDVPVYKSLDGGKNWIASYNGMPGGEGYLLQDVWGSSSSDLFTVHLGGIIHYDGSSWTDMDSGTTQALYGVWGRSGTDVFAVGSYGTILHYNGSVWSAMDSGRIELLRGVWAGFGTDVFVVGNNGTILHYSGSEWAAMDSGTTEHLQEVWGSSNADVFAVGNDGTILNYNGSVWTVMESGTTEHLQEVWGSSNTDVFVVGDNGTILRYNGSNWSAINSGTTEVLTNIWGSSNRDVFAVGDKGTILHYDGSTWSEMIVDTNENLMGIWGASSADVFVVGELGGIYQYDGRNWSTIRPKGVYGNSVTDLEFHRQNTNIIYAGTYSAGVYVSPNQSGNWLNLGTPDYDVHAISVSSLYAATEGGLLQCTGTGVIAGDLMDADTHDGIDHATVYTDFGVKCTSVAGKYMIVSPAGIYSLTAVADGHENTTVENVSVLGGNVTFENMAMENGRPDPLAPSASDTSSGSSYCFIATVAYGSPLAKQVRILRRFRDIYLLPYAVGQKLVQCYYKNGKPMAVYIASRPGLKRLVRVVLYPLVGMAWVAVSTGPLGKGFILLCFFVCGLGAFRIFRSGEKNPEAEVG